MMFVYYVLFLIGLVLYVLSGVNSNTAAGEAYSDTGNAVMLVTAVMLLIRIAWKQQRAERPAASAPAAPK